MQIHVMNIERYKQGKQMNTMKIYGKTQWKGNKSYLYASEMDKKK